MRRSLLIIFGMAASVWNALAQEPAEQAKYELIRETINFLATDKVVSQDTSFRISCETLDYDCFTQQLALKPIAGIERWYNSWRSLSATDDAGLVALRNQVFADIFERPGKGYRKQLAGYESYVSHTERLIDLNDEVPLEDTIMDTTLSPLIVPTQVQPTNPEELTDRNENPEKENTMIAYLAFAIGIIALIISLVPIFKKREQRQPVDIQGLHEQLEEMALRMKRLEQKMPDNQIKDAIANLADIMESVEKRVAELETGYKSDSD